MQIKLKLLSPLEKILPSSTTPGSRPYLRAAALRGERFALQLAYSCGEDFATELKLEVDSPFGDAIRIRREALAPVMMPGFAFDEDILSDGAGMYPDRLEAAPANWVAVPRQWRGIWISLDLPADQAAGVYPVTFTMRNPADGAEAVARFELEVLNAALPPQAIERTEWFYCDCIAQYYRLPIWSEEFWSMLERYFRNQTGHGCTRLLTPLFTPPLDTKVGSERLTAQLVGVKRGAAGYEFDFTRLERWMRLAFASGYRSIEFAHLFTQWGVEFTPKVEAETAPGKVEKIFGWNVSAQSDEYRDFLEQLFPALLGFLKQHGWKERCVLHVSDEPSEAHLENYRYASNLLRRLADGIPVTDAISEVEYFKSGLCQNPVPCINHIEPFQAAGISQPWTYYCCGPATETTNRFIHYPGARTRILGFQLYRYDCAGFLHWGYNFWNARLSTHPIDPYITTDADGLFPAGDPFLVYPGPEGPVDSIRHEILHQAFQDHRMLKALEAKIGRADTVRMLDQLCGGRLTAVDYPRTTDAVESIRAAIAYRLADSN